MPAARQASLFGFDQRAGCQLVTYQERRHHQPAGTGQCGGDRDVEILERDIGCVRDRGMARLPGAPRGPQLRSRAESGLSPDQGPVLVTGAAGGVGSIACALLAANGYQVEGSTGRDSEHDYLKALGVQQVLSRRDIATPTGKPLEAEHWAGCIDAVGGSTLANVLTRLRHGAAVAAIGLAGGAALQTTVIPFLLRGNRLLGIDSVLCPFERRQRAWQRIATQLPFERLTDTVVEATLAELPALGADIIAGQVRGRVIVDPNRS